MVKRVVLYTFGLFIAAFGVVFAVNSELGVSPVSSFPYVISLIIEVDLGIVVTAALLFYILLQAIILRKDFKIINLTQILFSMMFGYFVDLGRVILGDFRFPTYFGQLGMLAISITLLSTGILCFMKAKLVPLPAEGLVNTIAEKLPNGKFHRVKMVMDSTLVLLGIVFALVFLGYLRGIREGTLVSAVLIGKLMPYISKVLDPLLAKLGL